MAILISPVRLTRRELDVLELLQERWYTNKELADRLDICLSAVKHHMHNLFVKARVSSRYELRDWARTDSSCVVRPHR